MGIALLNPSYGSLLGDLCVLAASALPGLTVPPLRRLTFGKRPKSKQKVLPLAFGSRCARLPSFHHCSRGPPRRAIPGPSRLSRHPCRSTPYATIPLGLLMGRLASFVSSWIEKPEHVVAIDMDVLNIPVDKLRVVHPTDTERRVDDALSIHHCDSCSSYLLWPFRSAFQKPPRRRGP